MFAPRYLRHIIGNLVVTGEEPDGDMPRAGQLRRAAGAVRPAGRDAAPGRRLSRRLPSSGGLKLRERRCVYDNLLMPRAVSIDNLLSAQRARAFPVLRPHRTRATNNRIGPARVSGHRSARRCAARRTLAICAAAAASSATSRWPACRTWHSCAARSPMRASSPRQTRRLRNKRILPRRSGGRVADRHALGDSGLQAVGISAAGSRSRAFRRRAGRHVRRREPRAPPEDLTEHGRGRIRRAARHRQQRRRPRARRATLLHEHWGDNLFLESSIR